MFKKLFALALALVAIPAQFVSANNVNFDFLPAPTKLEVVDTSLEYGEDVAIKIYYESATGLKLRNLPADWKIEISHVDGDLLASSEDTIVNVPKIEWTETGVYKVMTPGWTAVTPGEEQEEILVNLINTDNEIVDNDAIIVKYSQLEYQVLTNKENYTPGEKVEITVQRRNLSTEDFVNVDLKLRNDSDLSWRLNFWRIDGVVNSTLFGTTIDNYIKKKANSTGEYYVTAPPVDSNTSFRITLTNKAANATIYETKDLKVAPAIVVLDPPDDDIIIFNPPANNSICDDIDGHWGENYMSDLLEDGLMPYVRRNGDNLCEPDRPTLRGEFVAWQVRAYEESLIDRVEAANDPLDLDLDRHNNDLIAAIEDLDFDFDDSPFYDVKGNGKYDNFIIFANLGLGDGNQIINGHPDGYFRPNTAINRAEVLKVLLESSGLFLNQSAEILRLKATQHPRNKFTDETGNSTWYTNYLHYAAQSDVEIIVGRQVVVNGTVKQRAAMSDAVLNAEAAKILFLAKELE